MGIFEGFLVCIAAAATAMWVNDSFNVGDYIGDEHPTATH